MVTTQTKRKTLVGVVVGTKNQKTVAVNVESYRKHRLYGKRFRRDKKYQVHDQYNKAKLGDKVLIQETRPYSATKRFFLLKVLSSHQGVK